MVGPTGTTTGVNGRFGVFLTGLTDTSFKVLPGRAYLVTSKNGATVGFLAP